MPAGIEMGVDLILVIVLLVALAFLMIYRATLKPLLISLADLFDGVAVNLGFHTVHLFGPIASFLRWVANEIDHGLAEAVKASEKGVVFLWHQMTRQIAWLGHLLADLAETIETKFLWLLLAFPPAGLLWLSVKGALLLPKLWDAIHHAAAAVEAEWRTINTRAGRLKAEIEAEIGRELAKARARVGQFGRDLSGVGARLRNLERALTKAGAAALVGTALATLGLSWLRRPCASKAIKGFCGVNPSVLEGLLGGLLVIASTVSLVQIAEEMVTVTEALAGEVLGSFRETKQVKPLKFSGYSGKLA